jgi:hypothetical protein
MIHVLQQALHKALRGQSVTVTYSRLQCFDYLRGWEQQMFDVNEAGERDQELWLQVSRGGRHHFLHSLLSSDAITALQTSVLGPNLGALHAAVFLCHCSLTLPGPLWTGMGT